MLPKIVPDKLPGAVCEQYIRCGKPHCRCAHGELHGPYWYRFWRDGEGRLHKEYVKRADVEAVRAACEARRNEEQEIRGILARGPRTVRWLQGKNIRWARDSEASLGQVLDLHQTTKELVSLASGAMGKPGHQTKAFALLSKVLLYERE